MTTTAPNYFWSDAAERRIGDAVAYAEEDRQRLLTWWLEGVAMMREFATLNVMLCDNGCGVDIEAIIKNFSPHSAEDVARRAREIAIDEEDASPRVAA